jgi:hypothetical protein
VDKQRLCQHWHAINFTASHCLCELVLDMQQLIATLAGLLLHATAETPQ